MRSSNNTCETGIFTGVSHELNVCITCLFTKVSHMYHMCFTSTFCKAVVIVDCK